MTKSREGEFEEGTVSWGPWFQKCQSVITWLHLWCRVTMVGACSGQSSWLHGGPEAGTEAWDKTQSLRTGLQWSSFSCSIKCSSGCWWRSPGPHIYYRSALPLSCTPGHMYPHPPFFPWHSVFYWNTAMTSKYWVMLSLVTSKTIFKVSIDSEAVAKTGCAYPSHMIRCCRYQVSR